MDLLRPDDYHALLRNSERQAQRLHMDLLYAELTRSERDDLRDQLNYEYSRRDRFSSKLKEHRDYRNQMPRMPQPVLNNQYHQEAPLEATLEEVDDSGNPVRSQAQAAQGPTFASPPDPQPNASMHTQQRQRPQLRPSNELSQQPAPAAPPVAEPQLGMSGPVIPNYLSQATMPQHTGMYHYGYWPIMVVCAPPVQYYTYNPQGF